MLEFIIKYHFVAMQLTGIGIFIYMSLIKRSKLTDINWHNVSAFVGFMVLVSALRMGLMEGMPLDKTPDVTTYKHFMLVWWEDAFFAMPIYYFKDHLKVSKKVWIPITITLSLMFGFIHLAYSPGWALTVAFFPYLLSYRLGKIYGFGTIMACHVLYDAMTFTTVKLMYLIATLPAQ